MTHMTSKYDMRQYCQLHNLLLVKDFCTHLNQLSMLKLSIFD
jgi:hypothetical protein